LSSLKAHKKTAHSDGFFGFVKPPLEVRRPQGANPVPLPKGCQACLSSLKAHKKAALSDGFFGFVKPPLRSGDRREPILFPLLRKKSSPLRLLFHFYPNSKPL
jgi:hypothetical protein